MEWTDQVQALTRAWLEAQQTVATQWATAGQRFSGTDKDAGAAQATQWYETAAKGFERWLGGMGGVQGDVAQRLFDGTKTYHRFAEFIVDTMKNLAPPMAQGTPWAEALQQHLAAIQEKMHAQPGLWMRPEAAAAVSADAAQLWELYLRQAKAMAAPWLESVSEARGHWGEAMAGDHRAIIRAADLFTDTFESTIGKLLGAPAIGYSREYQEKLVKAFEAWVEVRKAEAVFSTELVNIGFRSMQALTVAVQEKAQDGGKIDSVQELFNLWVEVAERTYAEAARSEPFAKSQADLVNAAMHYRVHERTLLEVYQRALQLPTRRELDDAYKHLHELRSQVKKLTKQVAALDGALREANAALREEVGEKLTAAEKLNGEQDKRLAKQLTAVEKQAHKGVLALEKRLDRRLAGLEKKLNPSSARGTVRKPGAAKAEEPAGRAPAKTPAEQTTPTTARKSAARARGNRAKEG